MPRLQHTSLTCEVEQASGPTADTQPLPPLCGGAGVVPPYISVPLRAGRTPADEAPRSAGRSPAAPVCFADRGASHRRRVTSGDNTNFGGSHQVK